MTKFLLSIALKGTRNDDEKRQRIGYMASIVGIVVNIILAITKLSIGILISSIGVIADGFNNATDTVSSVIAFIAFNMSHRPPDREHPYGHGRIEYIAGLFISFIVIFVGFQFLMTSFKEILNPTSVKFETIYLIILIISVFIKLWLAFFNINLSKRTNSKSIRAMGLDAWGDVLITGVVISSLVIGKFTSLPIDGYIGIIVAIIIVINGYNIVKETVSTLIGEAPDKKMIDSIKKDILEYKYITGLHDLHIHSYGENQTMAVIDVEFPAALDIVKVHKEITIIEKDIGSKYNLNLVIHMDPLAEESESRYTLRKEIKEILREYPIYKSMHDFKIMEEEGLETIEFDMVIYDDKLEEPGNMEDLKSDFESVLKKTYANKNFNITVDIYYG